MADDEMDDFTVRRNAGPENSGEVEDITGAAGWAPTGEVPPVGDPSDERPLDPGPFEGDDEPTLRPRTLGEFIGQEKLKENLEIFLEAAKRRGEALDHMLLAGPPGLGKTSLCRILAAEMGVQLHPTSGPTLERAGDMAAILTSLEEGDFLFIDEIHRLNRQIEEVLYPAMEDYALDIVLGQGPSARTIRMDLPKFTLVGATTRTGLMTKPLLDRFGYTAQMDYYRPEDLRKIAVRSAGILNVPMTEEGASQLARRSRGTPRVANRLLRRVRDYAEVRGDGTVDEATAKAALEMQGVDDLGLDRADRNYLTLIIDKFDGGPVGVGTISVALGEARDTVEEVFEPFLLQSGLIQRTSRGRIVTRRTYEHLGLSTPGSDNASPPDNGLW
ncbi:Holliday junction branch migration DNA helicase RuvB [Rubrobacter indicoceani]|uniref:Holliday junction branch migration DNA helicase RuvB n=1 Tax=Rubrobacter indicoceani TaxID=2051957 RepID=UPI001F08E56D|nr:Holliday junction branch migration DNA helicase RuvB [Rubrobacter indicoceani]